jgi:hypothetical protein
MKPLLEKAFSYFSKVQDCGSGGQNLCPADDQLGGDLDLEDKAFVFYPVWHPQDLENFFRQALCYGESFIQRENS